MRGSDGNVRFLGQIVPPVANAFTRALLHTASAYTWHVLMLVLRLLPAKIGRTRVKN